MDVKVEEQEEEDKVIPMFKRKLSVLSGGKDDGNNHDWLSPLNCQSVFLLRDQSAKSPIELLLGYVLNKPSRARRVRIMSSQGIQEDWVDPDAFCKRFKLYEILDQGKTDDEIREEAEQVEEMAEGEDLQGSEGT